jgi:2-oxoglutarate dehydrogenase E2 component (dihydrolipoamide succinyltransferase)
VLTEIKVAEGETVPVNSIVGTISSSSSPSAVAGAAASTQEPAAPVTQPLTAGGDEGSKDEDRTRTSPLVRRMAKEHGVDIAAIPGTGAGGRVTKDDVLRYVQAQAAQAPVESALVEGERVERQPLSIMRKKIAEHMVLSKRTSAHVHSVFHVSFAAVSRIREEKRADYERGGVRLTYLAFIAKAVTDALRRHPLINASLDGSDIVFKKDINLGIAVALDGGLIVPVIHRADVLDMPALSRAIADVADRARAKQLKPEDVQGGTFTITNPGVFGAQFGMPIINQPQVAILGIGTIEKRPVVVDDAIAIRLMAYLTLGYDHRLIDGATADQFMAEVKDGLEQFDAGAM